MITREYLQRLNDRELLIESILMQAECCRPKSVDFKVEVFRNSTYDPKKYRAPDTLIDFLFITPESNAGNVSIYINDILVLQLTPDNAFGGLAIPNVHKLICSRFSWTFTNLNDQIQLITQHLI